MNADPLLGRTLAGRYRLIAPLGTGRMSSVYLARHVLIERLSAIKVLNDSLVGMTDESPYRENFLREARAVNRINHPNIVEISDYGETVVTLDNAVRRTVVYLVMEYVPGESLQRVIARGPLPFARVIPIASQVGAALARAHQTGVIHRDVKPDNILLVARRGGGDVAKLTDFGVAKITQVGSSEFDQVLGTPGYIAPEYLLGETAIDGRADLYSLGVAMYEALSGTRPFNATNETDLLTAPLTEEPIPLSTRVALPSDLDELVMRCIRRRADDRPRDAFRLVDELGRIAAALGVAVDDSAPTIDSPTVATIDDDPPPSRYVPSIPPPPRLGVATPHALAEGWRSFWGALRAKAAPRRNTRPIEDALHRGSVLLEAIERAANIVSSTQRALDRLEAEAREFRGSLGNAIDTLADDLSRAHQRVGELTRLRAQLYLKKRNAKTPDEAASLAWEVATADDELRNSKATRDDLGHQIGTLQDSLFQRNNTHEAEVQRTIAALEGESAAIATMHRELEQIGAEIARAVGVHVA